MRALVALSLILAASACDSKAPTANAEILVAAPGQAMTLRTADGVTVYGRLYKAKQPKALILLFHQAGSSKDEYTTIAPQLVAAGYSALAIDQRSGGGLYGTNETAKALGREADFLDARPDLKAALDWGRTQKLPIILWGSSYSSSLIFPLGASDPQGIGALLSFSPGEYFDSDKQMVSRAAAQVNVPVLVASTREETGDADPIFAALPKNTANVRLVPEHGVHGSSTLIEAKNPDGADANMRAVLAFLQRVTAPRK